LPEEDFVSRPGIEAAFAAELPGFQDSVLSGCLLQKIEGGTRKFSRPPFLATLLLSLSLSAPQKPALHIYQIVLTVKPVSKKHEKIYCRGPEQDNEKIPMAE
jgi:hypothetical protein